MQNERQPLCSFYGPQLSKVVRRFIDTGDAQIFSRKPAQPAILVLSICPPYWNSWERETHDLIQRHNPVSNCSQRIGSARNFDGTVDL